MNPVNQNKYHCLTFYNNEIVGEFLADVVVEDIVILELKPIRRVAKAHEVQLVNTPIVTGKDVGLIINFGDQKMNRSYHIIDKQDIIYLVHPVILFNIFCIVNVFIKQST
ncbi:GxxExxY protein [candidate division KSB1 bacterium]|nr:GxxExxY protein [candidate division KSB1 bacterium]